MDEPVTILVNCEGAALKQEERALIRRLRNHGATVIIGTGTRSRALIGNLLALEAIASATSLASAAMTQRLTLHNEPIPPLVSGYPGKDKAQWKRETYGRARK